MAKTYTKESLVVHGHGSYLTLIERDLPEGASQTFPEGAPLKFSSGLLVVWVSPSDADLAAFALEAGSNTTGALVKVALAVPGLEIEANFLGASAADNVLAAADFGTAFDLVSNANLLGTGLAGWYIQDSTSDTAVTVSHLRSNQVPPQSVSSYPETGDTNARLTAMIRASVSHWD